MEQFDHAWFGCCPNGRIPSDDYGIPMCNLNDVTRSAVGLSQAASHWKQMQTHAPKWRECLLFKINLSTDKFMRCYSHSMQVPWFDPLLLDRDMFHRCFDLGFHDQMATSKWTTHQKGCTLIRASQNTSWVLHTYQQSMLWIHGTMWVPWFNGPYHWMRFKC